VTPQQRVTEIGAQQRPGETRLSNERRLANSALQTQRGSFKAFTEMGSNRSFRIDFALSSTPPSSSVPNPACSVCLQILKRSPHTLEEQMCSKYLLVFSKKIFLIKLQYRSFRVLPLEEVNLRDIQELYNQSDFLVLRNLSRRYTCEFYRHILRCHQK